MSKAEELAEQHKGRADDCGELARAILADREKQAARVPEGCRNQCDGCAIGAPINGWGNHKYPDGSRIACTKDRYAAPTEPSKPEQAEGVSERRERLQAACAEVFATTPPASAALEVVAYGAFKRPGVYRACHDFQGLLHDVPLGAQVEELVRKKDVDAALASKPLPEQVAQDSEHAENYRWLRNAANIDEGPAVSEQRCNDWGKWYTVQLRSEELDAAIRAARTRGEGSGT